MKRVKGHTASYTRTGANDSYHMVRCSCGWQPSHSRNTKEGIVAAFDNHKAIIISEMENITVLAVFQKYS